MAQILLSLLLSLTLTLIVELALALILKIRGRDLLIITLVNILTNPAVNFCYYWAAYRFSGQRLIIVLILIALEAAAVLIEFMFYKLLLKKTHIGKLKLSLLLNAASFAAGLIVSVIMRLLS